MGIRGNIKCVADGHTIYFYTHWRGSDLPNLLRTALVKGKSRWSDGPYLNRVIFQTMIGDDKGETGFAIWGNVCDNENPIVTVDHDAETVEVSGKTWTFAEYVKTTER